MANWIPPPSANLSTFYAEVHRQLLLAKWTVHPTNQENPITVASKLKGYDGKTPDGWVFLVVSYEDKGYTGADGTATRGTTTYHLDPGIAKEALDLAEKSLAKKEGA